MQIRTCTYVLALALVAAVGFAQAPGDAPAAPPALASPSAAAKPVKSVCTASCGGSSTVSCNGSSCSAVDRNCSVLERGHVTCNGVTTYCAKTCDCSEVCVCAVPCSEQCTSGGGFIQDCGSWGICATSCYCGGECLAPGKDPAQLFDAASSGACPALTEADALDALFD